ncbi:CAAX protease self-immunity [Laceyella tengchongensis]|uniref:CAAX protease self-immunity n=2 Tax=Laceyella tengchongensis TaxID=574699 RepID=A0AA45WNH5_9BACL|nr:CAAX protease self-immunity [Laceyella tengchongensis]
MNHSNMRISFAYLYIAVVLLVSWAIGGVSYYTGGYQSTVENMIYVMITPAVIALCFQMWAYKKSLWGEMLSIVKNCNAKAVFFAIYYPLLFIGALSVFSLFCGNGSANPTSLSSFIQSLHMFPLYFLLDFPIFWGEEYGWRGFLLMHFTSSWGKFKATILAGLVWALYHIPLVFLLAKSTGIGNPVAVSLVQALTAFFFSFAFSHAYYLSGALLPVVLLHWVWNMFNPAFLGNIYTNKQGIITGDIFFQNGEGIMGLVLSLLMAFAIGWRFIKSDKNCRAYRDA